MSRKYGGIHKFRDEMNDDLGANAPEPLKQQEIKSCVAENLTYSSFKRGYDRLASSHTVTLLQSAIIEQMKLIVKHFNFAFLVDPTTPVAQFTIQSRHMNPHVDCESKISSCLSQAKDEWACVHRLG